MNTNINAKRILCFGDSYTWGYIPDTDHERHPANIRWPGALQDILGENYEVIEEGLNSRTLVNEDTRPGKEGRVALNYIKPCLDTHDPVDIVVLMLGTNELKHAYELNTEMIGWLLQTLVKIITSRKSQFRDTTPELIIISPPIINEETPYSRERYIGGRDKSKLLGAVYKEIAKKYNAGFIDCAEFTEVGADGVHLNGQYHHEIAKRVAQIIQIN